MHNRLLSEMDIVQATKKEQKDKKKRQKTAIVGDMKPLEDTLPTLDLLLRDSQFTTVGQTSKRSVLGMWKHAHDFETSIPICIYIELTRS